MYGLDNQSGVNAMPALSPVKSTTPLWFTEGGSGLAPSYPGQDWFNMVQAEMLGVLSKGSIKPEKNKLNQLAEAISAIIANYSYSKTEINLKFQPAGSYATTQDLNTGLALKFDKSGGTITGKTTVKTTGAAISVQPVNSDTVHYELSNQDGTRGGYFGFGSAANPTYLQLINDRDSTSVAIYGGKIYVGNRATLTTNDISQSTGSSTSSIMSQNAATTELNKKFNITGGQIEGTIIAAGGNIVSKSGDTLIEVDSRISGKPRINVSANNGTSWFNQLLQMKSGTLGHINIATAAESGYLICGDTGIIIQWGIVSGSTSTSDYRQFPIPFKSACFQIVASYAEFGDNGMSTACYPTSKSEFIITKRSSTGALTSGNVRYIAVGY